MLHVGLPLSATRLWPHVPTSGSSRSPSTRGPRADPKEADSVHDLAPRLPGQPQLQDLQGLHCTPSHPCRQSEHEPCSWGRGQEGQCQALPAPCAHSLGPVTAELPHHPLSQFRRCGLVEPGWQGPLFLPDPRGAAGGPRHRGWGIPTAGCMTSKAHFPQLPRLRPQRSGGGWWSPGRGALSLQLLSWREVKTQAQLSLLLEPMAPASAFGSAPGIGG